MVASAARDLDVVLDCPVTAIDWRGLRVRVATTRGTLEAKAVLVTVPTTLLARGEPAFTPALPAEYGEAFAGLPLGIANKVFLELEPGALPFDGTVNFVASAARARTVSLTVRPAGHELLLAYFGGDYARDLEAQGALEAAAREELVRIFGAQLGSSDPPHHGHRLGRRPLGAWIVLRRAPGIRTLPEGPRAARRRARLLRRRRVHGGHVRRDPRRLGVGGAAAGRVIARPGARAAVAPAAPVGRSR